ncbi:MAG: hypothetical protein NZ837_06270 [Gammaproteobacteria bacterium]|nr:hypothetical protein [Gammaproteobacteria bacterium]
MKQSKIHPTTNELMQNRKISVRVRELQEEGRKRHNVTVNSLTEQLRDACGLAMQTGHATAEVGAAWAFIARISLGGDCRANLSVCN